MLPEPQSRVDAENCESVLRSPSLPIVRLEDAAAMVREWRHRGERTVLCHGRFDPLHVGHAWHFLEARSRADRLIVTVTPDRFAATAPGRPFQPEDLRVAMVAALRLVDAAALNRWPGAEEVLEIVRPDVYAKGIDYKTMDDPRFAREASLARALGIELHITASPKLSATEVVATLRASAGANERPGA